MTRIAFLVVVLGMAAASPALARPKDFSADAVLKTAAAAPTELVLDGRTWRCDGVLCKGSASGPAASQPTLQECRRVMRKVGPLAAYRSGARTLDAAALESCNAP